jgi:hypothetical protein
MSRVRAAVAAALIAGMLIAPAVAHQPWFNLAGSPDPATPYALENLEISQVIYGGLGEPDRVDWYAVSLDASWRSDIGIVVPAVEACEAFRPALVLVGPGLVATDPLPEWLTLPEGLVPEDAGVVIVDLDVWGEFYEPFSATLYWTGPDLQVDLAAGDYLLAVIEPDGDPGTYGLSLGGAEVWGGDPDYRTKVGAIHACDPPPVATPIPATPTP